MTDHPKAEGPTSDGRYDFCTTHWSVVLSAQDPSSPQAEAALERLCRAYWYPLYAFARRSGEDRESAKDLTQGFFARLLGKNYLAKVQRERGRFRSFLLTAFKHFLCEEWKKNNAKKRGGDKILVPFDFDEGEQRYCHEPADIRDPAKLYDRQWAMSILNEAKERSNAELSQKHSREEVEFLVKSADGGDPPNYGQASKQLGCPDARLRKLVFQTRKRHRELVRQVVAETVGSLVDIDEELRFLICVLREKW